MEVMKELSEHLLNRPLELMKRREDGVKVIGCFVGEYVPEEMIYAAGAIPITLVHGGDPESVEAAHSAVPRFLCPFARAQFGQRILDEQPYYNLVDMLAVPISCQNLRRIADLWNHFTDVPVFRLGIPHEYDSDRGLEYYRNMLDLFKQRLEEFTGNTVTEDKLKHAIELYNRMRSLLKSLSLLRKSLTPPFDSLDFIRLNHASYYADPVFMVKKLEVISQESMNKEGDPALKNRPRFVLAAPNIALGDFKVLNLVREAGGLVVAEEVCEGVRKYEENVEIDGDPLDALAVKYLQKRVPCAFMRSSSKRRLDIMVDMISEFNAQGLLWYQLKYCETYDLESFYFSEKMKEMKIPMLKLESEYDISDTGQLKTRIDAFIETF